MSIMAINLTETDTNIVRRSIKTEFGSYANHPGNEVSRLLKIFYNNRPEQLREKISEIRNASDEAVRKQVGWRTTAEAIDLLNKAAEEMGATKSEVIRAVIGLRADELQTLEHTGDLCFSLSSWTAASNNGVLPVKIIIDEVMRTSPDILLLSNYSRAALGRADFKGFLEEEGYRIAESPYMANQAGFCIAYKNFRFEMKKDTYPSFSPYYLPVTLSDKLSEKDIFVVAVKIPLTDNSGKNVDVREAIVKLCGLISERQNNYKKDAAIIAAGDFQEIPAWLGANTVLPHILSLCPTGEKEWSFVHNNGWRNKIDHIFISDVFECLSAENNWDFLTDNAYADLKPDSHIDVPGVPNHSVLRASITYKTTKTTP